jgi:hypothetical protein
MAYLLHVLAAHSKVHQAAIPAEAVVRPALVGAQRAPQHAEDGAEAAWPLRNCCTCEDTSSRVQYRIFSQLSICKKATHNTQDNLHNDMLNLDVKECG